MPWEEVFCLLLASPILMCQTVPGLGFVQGKLVKRPRIFVFLDTPSMTVASPVIFANWHPQYYYANTS